MKFLKPSDILKIQTLAKDGESIGKIALNFNITYETARNIARQDPDYKPLKAVHNLGEEILFVMKLRAEGMSYDKIAYQLQKKLNQPVCPQTVKNVIDKYNK